jgi:hypothetical protein
MRLETLSNIKPGLLSKELYRTAKAAQPIALR